MVDVSVGFITVNELIEKKKGQPHTVFFLPSMPVITTSYTCTIDRELCASSKFGHKHKFTLILEHLLDRNLTRFLEEYGACTA